MASNDQTFKEFRLEPNWNTSDMEQYISIEFELDDTDKENMNLHHDNYAALNLIAQKYSLTRLEDITPINLNTVLSIMIKLDFENNNFTVEASHEDGYKYLKNYEFTRRLIEIHGLERGAGIARIPDYRETAAFISAFGNYGAVESSVSLSQEASMQIAAIKQTEYRRSFNLVDSAEPNIFKIVKLRIAEEHYKLTDQRAIDEA